MAVCPLMIILAPLLKPAITIYLFCATFAQCSLWTPHHWLHVVLSALDWIIVMVCILACQSPIFTDFRGYRTPWLGLLWLCHILHQLSLHVKPYTGYLSNNEWSISWQSLPSRPTTQAPPATSRNCWLITVLLGDYVHLPHSFCLYLVFLFSWPHAALLMLPRPYGTLLTYRSAPSQPYLSLSAISKPVSCPLVIFPPREHPCASDSYPEVRRITNFVLYCIVLYQNVGPATAAVLGHQR